MPLLYDVQFLARLQRNNRVQVPVLIMWKHRLEPGEIFNEYMSCTEKLESEKFYAKLSKDHRFTIPKIVVQELRIEPGDTLTITLYAQTRQKQ